MHSAVRTAKLACPPHVSWKLMRARDPSTLVQALCYVAGLLILVMDRIRSPCTGRDGSKDGVLCCAAGACSAAVPGGCPESGQEGC